MIQVLINFLKQILRPLRKRIRKFRGALLFFFLKMICNWLKPRIVLTYLNTSKADGVGAQIQRILAIRSLSASLRLGYLHTEINSLAIHPLDPYQNNEEMSVFLLKLNHEFWMQSSEEYKIENFRKIQIKSLTYSQLFLSILLSRIFKKPTLIKIVEPYSISECDPDLYKGIRRFLPYFVLPPKEGKVIAIHYRRGVGGFAVQRGERVSREIHGNYFSTLAKQISEANLNMNLKVQVFTDSPTEDVTFSPPENQTNLWTNSPNFNNGEMQVLGLDVEKYFNDIPVDVEVFYGGDPLEVIKKLASADHLILSRSSFGYVGAILNELGQVYFPSQFWHAPMKGWRIIRESINN